MAVYLNSNDEIAAANDGIKITVSEKKLLWTKKNTYTIDKDDIDRVEMITASMGPFDDDVFISIVTKDGTVFRIANSHPMADDFLFSKSGGLSSLIEIDHDKIIEASCCTEDKSFIIYQKN